MISTANRAQGFLDHIDELSGQLKGKAPKWIEEARKTGKARFFETGLPTVKDEEWKYTNLSGLINRKFYLPTETKLHEPEEFHGLFDKGELSVVFVNGIFSKEHSSLKNLPSGCRVHNLAELGEKEHAALSSYLNHSKAEESLIALNRAFLKDGVVIEIADKAILKDPIHIAHITSVEKENAAVFPRAVIILGKSAEAEILESHISFSSVSYFVSAVTDVFLGQNAKLKYYKIQSEGPAAIHVGATRSHGERDSQFESFSFSVGAEICRNNLLTTLDGEGAAAILNGLYAVSRNQLVDNHTAVDHREPNCTSNQLYKGILDGNANAIFNGKIFVRQIAQQTNSYQLNKNLLLGTGCQVNTKPQLEILADNVRCTHGATIGQLNEDEMFYLRARAIPKALAIKMLCRGFVDDILSRVSNSQVRAKMDGLLTKAFTVLQ